MNDSNSTVPTTEFSVNITDPWTIAAISLLTILVTVASYRIYFVACKSKSKIGNKAVEVSRVKVQPKKMNFQSRAQMRSSQ